MPIVPFGRFRPDQSRFNPGVSTVVTNARPTVDGWAPLQALNVVSGVLPAAPRGAVSVKNDAGTWLIFVGTARNLYRVNSTTYAFEEVSRSADAYNLADSEYWAYEKWGNYLVATAVGSDFPQFYDLSTSGLFSNLTNATFEARFVKGVGDFLVFAGIDGDNRKIKWSGINDFTSWTVGVQGSDEQTLPSGGDIQGIVPQANNALVFQQSKISQMVFAPDSGVVFRFATLDPDRGVYAPRSLVNIGSGDFIYLAKNGFFRGVEAKPIGAQRVDKWFFDQAADGAQFTSGVADPYLKIVWFRFTDDGGTNFLVGYDYQLDEWLYSDSAATELLEAATVGYTLEALDPFGNIDTLAYSLDSRFWKGGLPGFAGFDATYKFGFFDGSNLEAVIETEDKMLNYPRRAITGGADGQGIQILVDTNSAQLAIAAKETQAGTLSFDSYRTQETGLPWFSSRVSGKWHRFKVKIPAGTTWTQALGLDVPFTDGGIR